MDPNETKTPQEAADVRSMMPQVTDMTCGAGDLSPADACRRMIPAPAVGPWRERWLLARDVLGGALLLAAWLALWTATWAAVAGPLSPAARGERAQVVAVERA